MPVFLEGTRRRGLLSRRRLLPSDPVLPRPNLRVAGWRSANVCGGDSCSRAAVMVAMASTGRIGTGGGRRGSTAAVGVGGAGRQLRSVWSRRLAAAGSHNSVYPGQASERRRSWGCCCVRVLRRMAGSPLLLDCVTGMSPLW
jgi:hypothetical protein